MKKKSVVINLYIKQKIRLMIEQRDMIYDVNVIYKYEHDLKKETRSVGEKRMFKTTRSEVSRNKPSTD